ncbi:P1 family peptidase [Algimonas porphyrae]|uniref:Peptidase T4 n=1 Tax=Algimonas porphyrae TaxID=1128113 RepID=A0ABQ5UW75_9PROT|nr:P1 family peptidase [Algimonas porphyrae]GLQ19526.1 peptidase T4 [Algimonas porphyrae]
MADGSSEFLPFSNLRIGHAHDMRVRTGVTVILPDRASLCAVDVRGGAPGTRETDTLAPGGLVDRVHAIVLAGGSVYGLGAADAVCRELGAQGIGFVAGRPPIPVSPIVPSAILFDNANGGDKDWGTSPPYQRLGSEAFAAASGETGEGAIGAGYGATAGIYPGGFGMATETVGEATVCALIAANPVGSPFLPGTAVPHAWIYERDGEFGRLTPPADYRWSPPMDTKLSFLAQAGQNTVIGAVVTDAALSTSDLNRLAIMAQDGLALSVQPSHTPLDGDTIFALSIGEMELSGPGELSQLGSAAARAVARALTRGVLAAR